MYVTLNTINGVVHDAYYIKRLQLKEQLSSKTSFHVLEIMVGDDPKLLDDNGEVPKPNKVVGGSIPDREIFSLLNGN